MNKILIVENDLQLASLLAEYLRGFNYHVEVVHDGAIALEAVRKHTPDLVVLDLMLPGMDGLSICRQLRSFYHRPVIMLTAQSQTTDEIVALETGVDDYIGKPVDPRLFLARVRSALRRGGGQAGRNADKITAGDIVICQDSRRVHNSGRLIDLSDPEYELLLLLAIKAGSIVSRDTIYRKLFNREYDGLSRNIDIKISSLRDKLGDDPKSPQLIKTIRSQGYMLCRVES